MSLPLEMTVAEMTSLSFLPYSMAEIYVCPLNLVHLNHVHL